MTSSDESDHKARVERALNDYVERQRRKYEPKKPTGRRNGSPEEDVVNELCEWYQENGFFINRFESKAKMINGVWRSSGINYGTPDLLGCDQYGFIHANEVKAPGRRSTAREKQVRFLEGIIVSGGFGIVCDSVKYLERIYNAWIGMPKAIKRKRLLLRELPAKYRTLDPEADAFELSSPSRRG